jgi:hypothetical protein
VHQEGDVLPCSETKRVVLLVVVCSRGADGVRGHVAAAAVLVPAVAIRSFAAQPCHVLAA